MIDLDNLETIAQEADQWGAWAIWEDLTDGGFVHVGNIDGVIPEGEIATHEGAEVEPIAKCYTQEIAEHIAAFNPSTVLEMIEKLRKAEEVIKEFGEELNELYKQRDYWRRRYQTMHRRAKSSEKQRDELNTKIERVRKIHTPIDALNTRYNLTQKVCTGCGTDDGNWQTWPCPTIKTLDKE